MSVATVAVKPYLELPEHLQRSRPTGCAACTKKAFEILTATNTKRRALYFLPCGRATCAYCGVRQREYRTLLTLNHFFDLPMYEYDTSLEDWRKDRDELLGEVWLQVPNPDKTTRKVFSSILLPGHNAKYIERRDRAEKILKAFEAIAGMRELYPRASWGSLRPPKGESELPGYEILDGRDDSEAIEVLAEVGYATRGKRAFDLKVPPKLICQWLPVDVHPTDAWRQANPDWETLEPTEEDWAKLELAYEVMKSRPRRYRDAA